MNPFEMVVMIVAIVAIAGVLRAKHGVRRGRWNADHNADDVAENAALREEIKGLKDRIHTLERIATDNNRAVDLDREIERLR